MKILTIGSDPEFFVLDKKGQPYPATPFAEGTKDNPKPIPSLGKGFFEQRDNVSFEGNIPPATTKENFIINVSALKEYFRSKVSKFGYGISNNGVEYFPKRMLESPEAKEFGCSSVTSSWDSYIFNKRERPTPLLGSVPFRVSGFHIHIGFDKESNGFTKYHMNILIGRLFDLFLTLPSHKIKDEPERIKTYGNFGMIREKEYGVECRTLSSFFTQPEWLPWVWDQIMKIEEFINKSKEADLKHVIQRSHFVNGSKTYIVDTFASIFNSFADKSVLNEFEETKRFYKDVQDKPNKINEEYEEKTFKITINETWTSNTITTDASYYSGGDPYL